MFLLKNNKKKTVEMNIYLVSLPDENIEGFRFEAGYDTYDSFVCIAKNKKSARKMIPDGSTYQDRINGYYYNEIWPGEEDSKYLIIKENYSRSYLC